MLEQISVFAENKAGRLCEIMDTLNGAGVNVRALNVADSSDFGIVRMLTNRTEAAAAALKKAGFTVKITNVVGFAVPDESGALYKAVKVLEDGGINIEYVYSLLSKSAAGDKSADIVVRANDLEKAEKLLTQTGVKLITLADIV